MKTTFIICLSLLTSIGCNHSPRTSKDVEKKAMGQYKILSFKITAEDDEVSVVGLKILFRRNTIDSFRKLNDEITILLWEGGKQPKYIESFKVKSDFVKQVEQFVLETKDYEISLPKGETREYFLSIPFLDVEKYSPLNGPSLRTRISIMAIGKIRAHDEQISLDFIK